MIAGVGAALCMTSIETSTGGRRTIVTVSA
jgi:hypothetical protein